MFDKCRKLVRAGLVFASVDVNFVEVTLLKYGY